MNENDGDQVNTTPEGDVATSTDNTESQETLKRIQFMGEEVEIPDPDLANTLSELEMKRANKEKEREETYRRGIQEKGIEIGQLRNAVVELQNQAVKPAQEPVQYNSDDFFDDPYGKSNQLIDQKTADLNKKLDSVVQYIANESNNREIQTFMDKFYKNHETLNNDLGRTVVNGICNEPDLIQLASSDRNAYVEEIAKRAKQRLASYYKQRNADSSQELTPTSGSSRSQSQGKREEEDFKFNEGESPLMQASKKRRSVIYG